MADENTCAITTFRQTYDFEANQCIDPNTGQANQSLDPNAGQPNQSIDPVQALDEKYNAAKKAGNWEAAAEFLNAFNKEDIQKRLNKLSKDQISKLHAGAVNNPRVGPDSQVAQMTIFTTKPVTIKGSPSKDYQKVNVVIFVKDFVGSLMNRFNARVKLTDGPWEDTREGTFTGGQINIPDWAIPTEGVLTLGVRNENSAFGVLGNCKLARGPNARQIAFEAKQIEASPVEVEAEDSVEAARKVGIKGNAEVDFKVAKVGEELSLEDEQKRGKKVTYKWKIRSGTDAMDFKQV